MNGFLKVNKAKGESSFDVVKKVRKAAKIKKVGHAGTLDPMATGLLILGIGSYTKKLGEFLGSMKSYEAELRFGVTSNTYDMEGELTAFPDAKPLSIKEIEKVIPQFRGEIMQVPPIFSAKKIKGKKAYQLARKGETIELEAQAKFIECLELKAFDVKTQCLTFYVKCSSGTYIRSLAHDLGKQLTVGATLSELKRVQIKDVSLEGAIDSDQICFETIESNLF